MKKLFLPLAVFLLCALMFAACSHGASDIENDSLNKNEVDVSVTEQTSNFASDGEVSTASIEQNGITEKNDLNKTDADNDINFSNDSTTVVPDKKTEVTSSTVESSTDLSETTADNGTKTEKNKVNTDKDGWVDKWY
ncbi:hypothetical protein [uncultured Eubacterium sp.]|uniref:hypothetical protein n=1 Tax=uncultured Eubacterium sp. TaxID=165185 RepID=UPI002609DF17|nr:hypothetical protein [uncultured Eubacterium sp.]